MTEFTFIIHFICLLSVKNYDLLSTGYYSLIFTAGITPTLPPGNETTIRVPIMNEAIVTTAAAVGSVIIVLTLLLIIFIVYLLRKINKMKIRSTEAVQVPNSLSIQEREDTSISVQDVTYEEIAERHDMLLTKNEAYMCVSTPLENIN